jgi:hypothetical protein
MSDFNTDPNRPIEEMLKDIERGAFQTKEHQANFLGAVLAPFAGLLVKLSRDASTYARRLAVLTWVLLGLTIVIAALTGVLVFREIAK